MHRRYKKTIFKRIFIPLFIVMLFQGTVIYAFTIHGNINASLNRNAKALLTERVDNRENEIESQFSSQWGNLTYYCNAMNELQSKYDSDSFFTDSSVKKDFLVESYNTLYSMLRNNAVNGTFLILTNNKDGEHLTEDTQSYYGLSIRDYDLLSGYTDKEDLMVLRCPSSIAAKLGCSLDNAWDALFNFASDDDKGDFFYKPLEEAYANPGIDMDNFTYFCSSHSYSTMDRNVVSYSIPLINSDGEIYGVLGVELLNSYLSSLIPYSELQGKNNSAYMLVKYTDNSNDIEVIATNGTLYDRYVNPLDFNKDLFESEDDSKVFFYTGNGDVGLCGTKADLTIYNKNTPFENERIALVGIVTEDSLFSVSQDVRKSLIYVVAFVLLIGVFAILFVSRWLTRPIIKASKNVVNRKEYDDEELETTNIYEIDKLIEAIDKQSSTINQTKAQSEFFMLISHEVRTPLNAISGYLNLDMEEHKKNNWNTEYLNKTFTAVNQLTNIADEMLEYTKIKTGAVELKKDIFKLDAIINRVKQTIELEAGVKHIDFTINIENIIYQYIIGDQLRIELIIQHLLDNAVKFTQPGGIVKAVLKEHISDDNELFLEFSCSDTGKGMSKEFCNQICAPFNQSDKSYSRIHGGLGIGLYLSRYYIEAMNGSFNVESTLGEGSSFSISMQVDIPDRKYITDSKMSCKAVRAVIYCSEENRADKIKEILKSLKIKSDIITDADKAVKRIKSRAGGEYAYSLCVIDTDDEDGLMDFLSQVKAVSQDIVIFTYADKELDSALIDRKINRLFAQSELFNAVIDSFGLQSEEDVYEAETFTGINAMIVEDNNINADILIHILNDIGITSKVFENGKLAVEEFEKTVTGTYQIIFMDIQMPVMNGYEATKKIRLCDREDGKNIPIVAVSANAFDTDIAASIAAGMNEHLAKPVNLVKIAGVVKKYCTDK